MINEEMTTAFTTALTAVQSDVVKMVTIALPVALGIMGLFLAIHLGVRFFRSVSS